jgi:hypothetical protein
LSELILQLVRKDLPSYPEVGNIIRDEIPIGTRYKILGFHESLAFLNMDLKKHIVADCYLAESIDITPGVTGWLPVELFAD